MFLYQCVDHLKAHITDCKVFNLAKITESDIVKYYSLELHHKIEKINETCNEILKKTEELIKNIISLCEKSVNKLEILKKHIIDILEKGKLDEIKNETEKKIPKYEIGFPDINLIELFYDQEFIGESKQFGSLEEGLNWVEKKNTDF